MRADKLQVNLGLVNVQAPAQKQKPAAPKISKNIAILTMAETKKNTTILITAERSKNTTILTMADNKTPAIYPDFQCHYAEGQDTQTLD